MPNNVHCFVLLLCSSSKALNVDRVRPPNDDSQDVTQFGSSGDDLQAFIDEFDLMISNQDVIQF